MKTFNRTNLPSEIRYNKKVYVPDTDLTVNKILSPSTLIPNGYIKVLVMQRILKGRLDSFNRPYQPSVYYFKPKDYVSRTE